VQEIRAPLPSLSWQRRLELFQPGQKRSYPLSLKADQFLYLVVEQSGVDIVATVRDPAGHLLLRVDSPNGAWGPEDLFLVSSTTGRYDLTVESFEGSGPGGRIALRIAALRPATAEDRRRAAAAHAYSQGRHLEGVLSGAPQAAASYREAAGLWKDLGETLREAWALYRLGLLDCAEPARRRNGAETLSHALDLFRRAGEERQQALGLADLGKVWLQLGEIENAALCFEQATVIWEKRGEANEQAGRMNDLAIAREHQGRFHAAIDLYSRAAEIWQRLGESSYLAMTRTNLGALYASLGESRLALDQYHRALALSDRQPNPARAVTLNKLGDVLLRVEGSKAALEQFREALELRRRQQDFRGQAVTLNSIGQAYLEAKRPRQALRVFEAAVDIFRRQSEALSVAVVLNNQGLAYEQLDQPGRARDLYQQALSLAAGEGPHLAAKETSLFGLARVSRKEEKLGEAESFIEQALALGETIRSQVWRPDLRASYQSARQEQYAFLIDLLAERHQREPHRGHDARAFAVAESARARSLLDLLSMARRKPQPEELQRLDELSRKINDRHRESLATASKRIDDTSEDSLTSLIETLRQKEAEVEGPRLALRPVPSTLSLRQVQTGMLDEGTLFLEYFLGEKRSFLFAVTPSTARFVATLPGRKTIEDAARRTYLRMTESHRQTGDVAVRQAAAQLSRMILTPVADLLERKRLVVVAPGALQLVPFGALPYPTVESAEGRPLVMDHELVSLPSASVLAALRSHLAGRKPAPGLLAILADPVTGPADERLPALHRVGGPGPATGGPALSPARLRYAREEAETILSLTGGEPTLSAFGFAADRNLVQSGQLRSYRILHFATHGLFNNLYPELSALALSAFDSSGHPVDGHLRAYEVPSLDLHADLVVLSACRTALSEEGSEGLAGLTNGFLHAGVPRLVVSLWDVDDHATSELMKRFYTALLRGKLSPAQALRQAQLSLLQEKRWRAPYHWAGFILHGEWRSSR